MGGENDLPGAVPRTDRTRRAVTKRKRAAKRLAERRDAPRGERRPPPRQTGGPENEAAAHGAASSIQMPLPADPPTRWIRPKTRSRRGHRRCGLRAQLCLAVAPPGQARGAGSAVRTNPRSQPPPVGGSERPFATALIKGSVAWPAAERVEQMAVGRQKKAFPAAPQFHTLRPTI